MHILNLLFTVFLLFSTLAVAAPTNQKLTKSKEHKDNVHFERVPENGIQPKVVSFGDKVHLLFFAGSHKNGILKYTHRKNNEPWKTPIPVFNTERSYQNTGTISHGQMTVDHQENIHVVWFDAKTGTLNYARKPHDQVKFQSPMIVTKEHANGIEASPTITAEPNGNIHIFWHAGDLGNEDKRMVFQIFSQDFGKTFSKEIAISNIQDGACGCCSISSAYANNKLYVAYRRAYEKKSRDMTIISSEDNFKKKTIEYISPWESQSCPVSTSSFGTHGLFTWETEGQIFLKDLNSSNIWSASGKSKQRRKNPVVAKNNKNQKILVWGEGFGWITGGKLQWQLITENKNDKALLNSTKFEIPNLSMPAVYPNKDNSFTILY